MQSNPQKKTLLVLKGWLLVYAILLALRIALLLGIVLLGMQWGDISDLTERLIGILALTVFLVGLYLLIVVPRPISRTTTLDSIVFLQRSLRCWRF